MKKYVSMLIIFVLCLGLCACGGAVGGGIGGVGAVDSEISVTLPTIPQQIAVPTQPDTEEAQNATEAEESTEPTGETYPWDVEFREEDYTQYQGEMRDASDTITGTFITWSDTNIREPDRELIMDNSSDIQDIYCGYPNSSLPSHEYFYGADGTYKEFHYLDNGYYDEATNTAYMGTTVYYKVINPDGSYTEYEWDENGNSIHEVRAEADGYYSERLYYENGNMKKYICNDPATGAHREEEYFENGKIKYNKYQSPERMEEVRYDEEDYCTYFYCKDSNYELELITDESGKLIKVVEYGTVYENDAIPAWVAGSYNFRG